MDRHEIRKEMIQKEIDRITAVGLCPYPGCIEHNYDRAVKQCADGVICAECGQSNDNWDDVGWWYKHTPKGYAPVCTVCHGPPTGNR